VVTDLPLIDAIDRFLSSLKAAKKSPHTIAAYRRDLEAVAELLVDPIDKTVDDMSLADVTVPALRSAFGMQLVGHQMAMPDKAVASELARIVNTDCS
jgi:site-specific recombinase XerC